MHSHFFLTYSKIKILEESHAKQLSELMQNAKTDIQIDSQTNGNAVSELQQAIKQLQEERSIEHIQYIQIKEDRDRLEKELEDLQELKRSEIELLKRTEEQLKETHISELAARDAKVTNLKGLLLKAQKAMNDNKLLLAEKTVRYLYIFKRNIL
jgi:TolA-binding protein